MQAYASLQDRLYAHLGDIIFTNIIACIICILVLGIEKFSGIELRTVTSYGNLLIIIWCIYSSIMNSHYFGGTLGKQYWKLRIIKVNHAPISVSEAFVRFVLGFLLFGMILGMLPIYFTKKKQGIHDLMLNTVVVKKS